MTDHTRAPWRYRIASNVEDGIIIGGEDSNAAFVPGYNDHPHNIANAAFIVKAVNSYDALIMALVKIAAMDPDCVRADDLGRAVRIAAQAIGAAVESPPEPTIDGADEIERLKAECFALAANQCHAGYCDDYGNHRCEKIDALKDALLALIEAVEIDSDKGGKGISGYTAGRLTDARAALATS